MRCRKWCDATEALARLEREELPVAAPNASEMEHDPVASAAVAKLSERELGEMRKLARPPMLVRMALSLVQALIKSEDELDEAAAGG